MKSYLLKIRGGVEVDSQGNKAGKGPLVAEEISNTLGTSQDQYLFQATKLHKISSTFAFDGYNQSITGNKTMTLRAGMYNCSSDTVPCIVDSIGGQAERAWEGDVAPCLKASHYKSPPCVMLENHPADSRVKIDDSGKCQTLTSRMGTGGGNVPMVMCMATPQANAEIYENISPTITAMAGTSGNNQPVVCLEGNGSRPSHRGDGYKVADEMFTLNTTEVHSVCYGICSYDSNAMRSANPSSGIYEAATSRTLDLNGGNPACNQGGMVVIEPKYQGMILDDITPKHSTGDIAFTTRGTDYKRDGGLCVVMSYQKHTGPLMASGYEKNGTQEAMSDMYVVEPMYWDGSQTAGTLTANNAGGNQRMPDKNHFQCVLQPVASFYPQMKAESQCYREDGVANTLVNGTNPGFQNGVVVPK